MDTLALLCNLHADGPTTLRRLQGIGCCTIDDLQDVSVLELASALEADPELARRFAREGRLLGVRFGEGERAAAPSSPRVSERAASRRPPEDEVPTTPLAPGAVEGLDEAWCRALAGQGLRSLEDLVEAPGLALARALGRGYPALLDLQLLARRRLAAAPPRPAPERRGDTREVTLAPFARPAGLASRRVGAVEPVEPREHEARRVPGSGGPFS